MVNTPTETGPDAGAQSPSPPPWGQNGGFWMLESDRKTRGRQIAPQAERDVRDIYEGLTCTRAGAGVRDRIITYVQQRKKTHPGLPFTTKCFQGLVRATGNQSGRAATANLVSSFQVKVGQA